MVDTNPVDDDLRPEYDAFDFKNAERGKYVERFRSGTNIVRLDPDVLAAFPDEKAVNDALRFVKRIAEDANRLTTQKT